MNTMPINSVKFGELYHQNTKYTIPQKYLLRDIEHFVQDSTNVAKDTLQLFRK